MMTLHKNKLTLLAISIATGIASLGQATAQELEVIEVKAQKRAQAQQDIPVAVSVLGENALERLDVKNFDDVTRVSPSLTVEHGGEPQVNAIRMRGVGTAAYSIGVESSVAVVVDEVPLMMAAQAFNNLSDIQQVEVLRGPQGTLFGKNASAGVVNVLTKAASSDFEGRIEIGATSDNERKGQIMLSGPVSEDVNYRINGYYKDREGYITNLTTGNKLNGDESYGIRGKLDWYLTDNLDATFIYDTSHQTGSNVPVWVETGNGVSGEGENASEDNRKVRRDTDNEYETDQTLAVAKFNYLLSDDLVLTSVSSFQQFEQLSVSDEDLTDVPLEDAFPPFLLDRFDPLGLGGPQVVQDAYIDAEAFTQEIRLTGTPSESLEYIVGLFFSDQSIFRDFDRKPLLFVLNKWEAEAESTSTALFGQGSVEIASDTFVDIGLRFNHEKISVDFTDYYGNGFTLNPTNPARYQGDDSQNAVTGKISLRHFLHNGTMVYGAVSTGYKGQAYDVASGFSHNDADQPVGEETSVSYEIGIKGFTDSRNFSYDIVAFLTNFDDYQAQGARTDENGTPIFALNNVGELQTKGIEAEFSYQATDALRIDASVAYTRATIESFVNAPCYGGQTEEAGCMVGAGPGGLEVQDLTGNDLNNSPDLKYNLAMYWEQPAESFDFSWFAQANYQWQDDVSFDLYGDPLNKQDAYGIGNLGFGIVDNQDKYKVTVFANNLFDEHYSMGYSNFEERFQGETALAKRWSRGALRYVGVNVSYQF